MSNDLSSGQRRETFYGSGPGDRLIDPSRYPREIVTFLDEERKILDGVAPSFETLIEVGCMHGRHALWAIAAGKRYIGIDVIERSLQIGRTWAVASDLAYATCRFINARAEHLPSLVDEGVIDPESSLGFFPFNSFGNMEPLAVISSLAKARLRFVISTYATTPEATEVRERYYKACFGNVTQVRTPTAITFVSDDGLHSAAFYEEWLTQAFADASLHVELRKFAEIGNAVICV